MGGVGNSTFVQRRSLQRRLLVHEYWYLWYPTGRTTQYENIVNIHSDKNLTYIGLVEILIRQKMYRVTVFISHKNNSKLCDRYRYSISVKGTKTESTTMFNFLGVFFTDLDHKNFGETKLAFEL